MKRTVFDQLREELYHEILPNGLNVYILPKKEFNKTFVTFTTKYGSVDNRFIPLGASEELHVPDGIAHFLEHKLFEKEHEDVFQKFSKQGASVNAFTSFTRTAYLFSSTSQVEENLETLMNFVQDPYFSEKTVEKEKGIIGQEITMYEDNPDWRNYFGVIENMYHNHPVQIDIAGTKETIAKINKDLLYTCYETFYHPSNMLLFVIGPVDPPKIGEQIRNNQANKTFKEPTEIKRFFDDEKATVAKQSEVLKMPVQTSKVMIGIKEKSPNRNKKEWLQHEMAIKVWLDLLFSKSTTNYENLYNEGLIDDSFSYDYTEESGFGFALIGGDTNDPNQLSTRVKEILLQWENSGFKESDVERVRKKKIGAFLRALNSPEFIANQFTRYRFNGVDLFDVLTVLEEISITDIINAAKEFIAEERITIHQIVPKG